MAKYSVEDMEKDANAVPKVGTALGVSASLGILGAILGSIASSSSKNNKLDQINAAISDIDRQISEYKGKFLGSVLYADEIAELEQQRAQLIAERNRLM